MKKILFFLLLGVSLFIFISCSSDGDTSDNTSANSKNEYNIKYDENNPDIYVYANENDKGSFRSVSVISKDYDDYLYVEPNSDEGIGYLSYFNTNGEGVTMKLNSSTYEYESFRYTSGDSVEFLQRDANKFKLKLTNASGYSETIDIESDELEMALYDMIDPDKLISQNLALKRNSFLCKDDGDLIDEIECVAQKGLGSYFKDETILKDKDESIARVAAVMYGMQGATTIMRTIPTFLTKPFKKIATLNAISSAGFLANTLALRKGEPEKAPAYKYATTLVEGLEECEGWINCSYDLLDNTLAYAQVVLKGKPKPTNNPIEAIQFYHEDSKSKKLLRDVSLSFHQDKNGSLGSAIYARRGSVFSVGPLEPNKYYYLDVVVVDEEYGGDMFENELYSIINDGSYITLRNKDNNELISRKAIDDNTLVKIPLHSLLCGKNDSDISFCSQEECSLDIFDLPTIFDTKENECKFEEKAKSTTKVTVKTNSLVIEKDPSVKKIWPNWPKPETCPFKREEAVSSNYDFTLSGDAKYDGFVYIEGDEVTPFVSTTTYSENNFIQCLYYKETKTLYKESFYYLEGINGYDKIYNLDGSLHLYSGTGTGYTRYTTGIKKVYNDLGVVSYCYDSFEHKKCIESTQGETNR